MSKSILALRAVALAAAIACAGVLAAMIPAASATAAIFTPNPQNPVAFGGDLSIEQNGFTITCRVWLGAKVVAGGYHAEISDGGFSEGDWRCGWLVTPTGFPTYVYPISTYQVLFSGFSFNTILGSCSGSFTATWSNPGDYGQVVFDNTVIPGAPGNCTLNGILYTAPSLQIV